MVFKVLVPVISSFISKFIVMHTIFHTNTTIGNEVCPNTECKKINPGTTGTENTRTEVNGTMDDVGQT